MSEHSQQGEFTRELPVQLNDHELQTYGRMLAEKVREVELTEERKKAVVKEWSTKIGIIRQDIKRIADARAKGEELRPVRCAERLHGNVIEIVRLDRGEVVDTRPADLRDLQTTIPGTDEPQREGTVLQFVPAMPDYAAPSGFDDAPHDLGPDGHSHVAAAIDATHGESYPASIGSGTGIVYDGDDRLGEVVMTSAGDAAFIGGDAMCPACGLALTEDDETMIDAGMPVHKACASGEALVDSLDQPQILTSTIAERIDAPVKKKRERSSSKNSKKTS